ncbi:MAG TPA: hypothetical protein VIT65_05450 [Microlunatus sp.]
MTEKPRSALVVLHPGPVTSAGQRASEVPPPRHIVDQVTNAFAARGFQVGPCVGISFAITADRSVFERTFGVDPQSSRFEGPELPLDHVGPEIHQLVDAVTVTEPPAFGPGNP